MTRGFRSTSRWGAGLGRCVP